MIHKNTPVLELGPDFYDPVRPAQFPKALLRYKNLSALKLIGLENQSPSALQAAFCEFKSLQDNLAEPLALRYHGHQFAHYNPDLGDGRGFLFSQHFINNKLFDLGTKGSGTTPYSRRGDGRLTLKGAMREALATEMLESLGVNTSKTLIFFETGENLERNDEPSPTRSAVLTRLNHSHIRFGTFQRLAFLQQDENIKKLIRFSVKYHFPELMQQQDPQLQAELFFKEICLRSADLVASVMMAGFVHGVLNTDNMNITGELFDYGPYRFMPEYNPDFVAAYFDHQGLYRFGRQPITFAWNLEQLGRSLQVAFPDMDIKVPLESFGDDFNQSVKKYFLQRLNLQSPSDTWTSELISVFFELMQSHKLFFEQSFFDFHSGWNPERLKNSPAWPIYQNQEFQKLQILLEKSSPLKDTKNWIDYLSRGKPETLLIDEIEKIWSFIDQKDDWSAFNKKIEGLQKIHGLF